MIRFNTFAVRRSLAAIATVAAFGSLAGGGLMTPTPAQATEREVAFCQSGFSIATGNNKAFCTRTTNLWVDVGRRNCALNGVRTSDEAQDGGDKCKGRDPITAMVSGPALLCEVDPAYGPAFRTRMVHNGADQCQRQQRVVEFGDINTRAE